MAKAEVAYQLARRGICCVVIDQNPRPYGKIEDGLPRLARRPAARQEMRKIDDKAGPPRGPLRPRHEAGSGR